MSNRKDGHQEVKDNRERKLKGGFNSIPFGHKRLMHYIPGVQKRNITIVTANSGVGKSKLTKNLYAFRPVEFVLNNPGSGLDVTVKYFCLEEPAKAWTQSHDCYTLKTIHGDRVSIKELKSMLDPEDPHAVVNAEIIDKLDALDAYFDRFDEKVHLIDDIRRPYAIYKHVQDYMETLGDWTLKPVKFWDPVAKVLKTKMGRDKFILKNPNHYVIVIIDHLALIEPEKGQTLHEAIRIFSSRYATNLRNVYDCAVIMVQQQSSEKEKQQYTYKGASIESKLEPSLDGLGDCKLTQRDADEVIGLFAPDRYEIAEHEGYDISKLNDNYRSLSILKSRDGMPNKRLALFFDGATNYFSELPKKADMTRKHYDKVYELSGRSPKI